MANTIEWDEKYSVDIPELDGYQKELFAMFNALIEMKSKKLDAKAATNMITDINDYSKEFFFREERILKKRGYPDLEVHAKAHRRFIKNSISLRREIAEDMSNLTMEVILDLRDWLLEHIETSDSMYVPFLRIHQYVDDCGKKN